MLWFQLAWQFGCPVAELQQRMSFAEYLEWAEYLHEIPGGDDGDNWRAAMIASTIAKANCGKSPNDFPVKDFMPKFAEAPAPGAARPGEVTDWRAMKAILKPLTSKAKD